ncbi:hypothetical protein [Cyclobacterium xiamenense]|uniref:hypothetical protein n=1 Tax=Cyclobacterium xiamenense TaxID=1297121 RepID=UPI0035CEE394
MKKIAIVSRDIFSKTNQRIRQQVYSLLKSNTFDVTYFNLTAFSDKVNDDSMGRFFSYQINCLPVIEYFVNSRFKNRSFILDDFDVIITNVFEFTWRDKRKIIFLYHDDFIEQSKFLTRPFVKKRLFKFLKGLKEYQILSQSPCFSFLKEIEFTLFSPWTEYSFVEPKYPRSQDSRRLLYFGFMDNRIDFKLIVFLATQGYKIDFVGRIVKNRSWYLEFFSRFDNVDYLGELPIAELDSSKYYASLSCYKPSDSGVHKMFIGNRTLKLFSKFIPVIHVKLPCLFEFDVEFFKLYNTKYECVNLIESFKVLRFKKEDFYRVLEEHSERTRLSVLLSSIEKIDEIK